MFIFNRETSTTQQIHKRRAVFIRKSALNGEEHNPSDITPVSIILQENMLGVNSPEKYITHPNSRINSPISLKFNEPIENSKVENNESASNNNKAE